MPLKDKQKRREYEKKYIQRDYVKERIKKWQKKYASRTEIRNHKKGYLKEYNFVHKNEKREYNQKYCSNPVNKNKKKQYNQEYYAKHKSDIKKQQKEYHSRLDIKEKRKKYEANPEIRKKKIREQIRYVNSSFERRLYKKVSQLIRFHLNKQKTNKSYSTKKLLDYSISDLKKHIEKQFSPEMNWNNYGHYWVIDHKIPCSWFQYKSTNDYAFKICWSLENLQPLIKEINQSKLNYYADITPFHFNFLNNSSGGVII